ncbi:roundabout homolog 2-like [Ixodes scapularis]|uniref:roundabout homolog 2-like n=1 Tax=Ixodes scapularis TaxID=6945 RepID=UPI001C37E7F7|nr:roundabout homolog 2-like [Ixodes scapularis]
MLITSVVGEPTMFECPARGFPLPSISWAKESVALDSSPKNGTLLIEETQTSDAGTYACTATNSAGIASQEFVLTVHAAPTIQKSSEDVVVVAGQPAILWCNTSGDPAPQVTWHKDNRHLQDDSDAFEILPNAVYIYTANVSDSGQYVCTVQNHVGSSQAVRNLDVLDPPAITVFYPEERTVVQGSEVSLVCQARGHPKPTVYWEHNGNLISNQEASLNHRYIFVTGGELKIPVAEVKEAGEYRCTAKNQAGWDTRTTTVTVHGRKEETSEGVSVLALDSVSQLDQGTYVCVAANNVGQHKASADVKVRGKP